MTTIIARDTTKSARPKQNLSVVIFSPLADQLPACALLWWLARALDANGSGNVQFTVKQAAELLHRDHDTIRRYLKDGQKFGRFRYTSRKAGKCHVFLTSLDKVALSVGLTSLGTISRISVKELSRIKLVATESEADALQRASQFRKLQETAKSEGRKRLHSLNSAFRKLSDNASGRTATNAAKKQKSNKKQATPKLDDNGKPIKRKKRQSKLIIHVGRRCIFVSDKFTAFGGSQAKIASRLNRSDRTIRRRLSNAYRTQRNDAIALSNAKTGRDRPLLPKVMKRQLAIQQNLPWNRHAFDPNSDWTGDRTLDLELCKLFTSCGRTFKAGCNIYFLPVELVQRKYHRTRFKKQVGGH